jgi:Retrotransposon gag protein
VEPERLDRHASDPPYMSTVETATADDLCRLPYGFQDLEVFHVEETDEWSYYAKWEGKTVSSNHPTGPWFFEDEEQEITKEDWNTLYPGYEHIKEYSHIGGKIYNLKLNEHRLGGTFSGKNVLWSNTNRKWVYTNGHSVTLPPTRTQSQPPTRVASPVPRAPSPEAGDSQDEELVTSILERTQSSLVSLTEQIRTGTSEPNPTRQAEPPGMFPVTPEQRTQLPTPSTRAELTPVQAGRPPPLPTVRESPTPAPPPTQVPSQLPTSTKTWSLIAPPAVTIASTSKGKAPAKTSTMSTSAAATTTATPKVLGSSPDAYDGTPNKAQAFWSALENYFYLNDTLFTDENRKIATALTFFKIGTPAGEWARDKQKTAMAVTPVNFRTWAAFKTAFKKHFIPAQSQLESTKNMYNLKMGTRDFNSWYQEWSTHAEHANVDENTRMFAFRTNIPYSLHQKILMHDPQPTTMTTLVEKA